MNKSVYPCLWFDGKAREAAEYYTGIFSDSKLVSENPMVVIFEIKGNRFMCLNGGPKFQFNEALSLVVECENQAEIDHYWNSFTKEGQESRCGWCKDKYGVSWQIIPADLGKWMNDPQRATRVGKALLRMNKLIISDLQKA
ncbi:MAG TPA: VOC family protein [Bacteroidia bacterium]|nr:VOC family protein [Bacteroidia bacterium]